MLLCFLFEAPEVTNVYWQGGLTNCGLEAVEGQFVIGSVVAAGWVNTLWSGSCGRATRRWQFRNGRVGQQTEVCQLWMGSSSFAVL